MTASIHSPDRHRAVRIAMWSGAALLLVAPLLAMQFTDEVAWTGFDFALMAATLLAACGGYELASRVAAGGAGRVALVLGIGTAFTLVWINLAVGVFGHEDNLANLLVFGVVALSILGAFGVRGRPGGMAWVMCVTACAQAGVAATGWVWGFGTDALLAAAFVLPWGLSALLFHLEARSARRPV